MIHGNRNGCQGANAMPTMANAAMPRATKEKLIAFSAEAGVTKSGMPEYDRTWPKLMIATAKNVQPNSDVVPARSLSLLFQLMANTSHETIMENTSIAVWMGK